MTQGDPKNRPRERKAPGTEDPGSLLEHIIHGPQALDSSSSVGEVEIRGSGVAQVDVWNVHVEEVVVVQRVPGQAVFVQVLFPVVERREGR